MRQFSIHPSALCESNGIGPDTRIEAFTYIAHKVKVGQNCVMGPHVFIGRDVIIGDRVIVMNQIAHDLVPGHELSVEENSFGEVNGLSPAFRHE